MAIQKSNSRMWNVSTTVSMNGNVVDGLAEPTGNSQSATKYYVDTQVASVGGTDLSYVTASRTLESSTGNDVVLPLAATDNAGMQSAAHYDLVEVLNIQGFESITTSTLTFTNATRTLSVSPVTNFTYWVDDVKYVKSAEESIVIPNVEGIHYVYFDGPSLSTSQTFNYAIINNYAFVAELYWDATNAKQILLAEERHGVLMSSQTHSYLHRNFGAQLSVGGALGDIVADGDGSSDTHIQFSNVATTINDEDILLQHSARTSTGTIPIYYRSGLDASSIWRVNEAGNICVLTTGTGRAAYNQLTGGSWVQTEVANNQFMLMHVLITNDSSRPYAMVQGQGTYSTINDARSNAELEINDLVVNGLPTLEFVFVGTIIIQTSSSYANSGKSRIRTTADGADYIDLRDAVITRSGIAITVTDHNDLANIGTLTHAELETAITNIETKTDYISVTQAVDLDSVESLANDAVLNADTDTTPMGFVIDEDNMASNSATKVPTQQSVKAYVDAAGGATNLSYDSASYTVASDTGTDATLTIADGINPGLMSTADFTKLSGIEAGATVTGTTNLDYNSASFTVTSDTGTDATLTVVDAINPGLMTVADKSKLDGIEASADVTDAANVDAAGAVMNSDTTVASMNFVIDEDTMASNLDTKVPTQQSVKAYADSITGTTNLSYTAAAGNGTVNSDTGTNATIPACTVTNAGLFTPAEKTKLTNIETLADVTDTANVSTTGAGARAHGYATMSGGTPTLASNSLNIASITDVDVGKIRFNFSGGLGLTTDAYTVAVSLDTGGSLRVPIVAEQNSSYVEVWVRDGSAALSDSYNGISIVIYSNH